MKIKTFALLLLALVGSAHAQTYTKFSPGCALSGSWNSQIVNLTGTTCVTGNIAVNHFNSGTGANASTAWFGDGTWKSVGGGGDVFSSVSSSVDSEIALFSSTGGKTLKRSTGTGFAVLTSGVLSTTPTIAAGSTTGFAAIATSGSATDLTGTVPCARLPSFASGDVTSSIGSCTLSIPAGTVTDAKASLAVKPAVAVVATANQALSGIPTIDGSALADNSLVLNTAQSTGAENGPWAVHSGAWTRPTWYASGSTTQAFQFITTFVRLGTSYQGTTWRQTAAAPITIDTTATTWVQTPLALNATSVSGTLPAAQMPALTGDCTTSAGAVATTCTKTGGVAFATSATTDTTNGSNIASGTVAAARIAALGANPSASVGLTAVNGSATTYVRSDGAPALDVTIIPTWTGVHTWSLAEPRLLASASGGGTNGKLFDFDFTPTLFSIRTRTDVDGAGQNILTATRTSASTALTDISIGNTTNNPTFHLLGTGAVTISGTITGSNFIQGTRFVPTGNTLSGNSVYLPSANTLGFSASSTQVGTWATTGLTVSTAVNLPSIASSSSAQTGTVCLGTSGSLTYDTTTTCLLSARRFKEKIFPLDEGLDAVLKLKPVSYFFRSEVNGEKFGNDVNATGQQLGFIAEDVRAVDPRLVTVEKDGQLHSVRYLQMTALLTKAIQEQNDTIRFQQIEIYFLDLWCTGLTGAFLFRRHKRR